MPSPHTPYVPLPDLLDEIRAGSIDIVDFGRLWVPKIGWIAELYQSLAMEPQRPIGSMLLWVPHEADLGRPGRYGATEARVRILDGQHRCLGLAAGCGIRPAWFSQEQWEKLGGPDLQVAVVLESTRRVHIGSYHQRYHPQIPLRALLDADSAGLEKLLEDTGVGDTEFKKYFSTLTEIRHRLLKTNVLLEWLCGTAQQAAEAYRIRGRHASTVVMSDGEIETTMVALVAPGVRAQALDLAMEHAAEAGFASAVTVTALNDIVQFHLPPDARHKNVVSAGSEAVRGACEHAVHACDETIGYLAEHGLIHEDFVCMPAGARVLMKLFARFPQAAQDDFAWRWLARALAARRYRAAPQLARADSAVIAASDTYPEAITGLQRSLDGTGLTLGAEALSRRGAHGGFGPSAALMAMALADPAHGPVRDLADEKITAPHPQMRLIKLWDTDPHQETLGNRILATEATDRVLRACGGWNAQAAEQLQCPSAVLSAQFIPQPLGQASRKQPRTRAKERDQHLLTMINKFLAAAA